MVFGGPNHTTLPMARLNLRASAVSVLAVAAMAAAWAAPGIAWAQESERPGLFDRIFGGSERFGSGSERGAPPVAAPERTGTVPPSGTDVIVRVDRLEAQIRQLTGVIEQLQYRNQQLEALVRRMQDGGLTGAAQPRPLNPPAPAGAAAPGRRGDAFDPTQHPNAPGAPHTLGTVAAAGGTPPIAGVEPPVGAPGGRGAHAPLDLATMPPGAAAPAPPRGPQAGGALAATQPPSQTPKDEFDLAYGYVLRKDYAL